MALLPEPRPRHPLGDDGLNGAGGAMVGQPHRAQTGYPLGVLGYATRGGKTESPW